MFSIVFGYIMQNESRTMLYLHKNSERFYVFVLKTVYQPLHLLMNIRRISRLTHTHTDVPGRCLVESCQLSSGTQAGT